MKKKVLWMMAAILVCGLTAGALMACGDDKDEDLAQDKMEALCHVLVSEDVLKVADITVHYLDAKGQEATEQMTTRSGRSNGQPPHCPHVSAYGLS